MKILTIKDASLRAGFLCHKRLPYFKITLVGIILVKVSETSGNSVSDNGVVYWNPELGTKSDNGVVRSPASVLDHEIDHGVQSQTNPEQYEKDSEAKSDSQYDTKEERRVVTGSEQKTARANGEIGEGEVTRTNHQGTPVVTKGVTSTKINAKKTNEYNKANNNKVYEWSSEY